MKEELLGVVNNNKNLNEIYGLDQNSIQKFVSSINSILQSRDKDKKNTIIQYNENYEEGVTCEIISDYAWYHELDNEYLKQYGIIRIIGITEAIIDKQISKSKHNLPILKKISILNHNLDISELQKWIKLRNILVHKPFEHYSPVFIDISDVEDCMVVCLRVLTELELS